MTEIYRGIIDHPSAWTGRALGGKDAIVTRLTSEQLDAIDELLRRTRHLAPQAVARQDFDHPAIDPVLDDLFEDIQHGRGAVVVAGMTRERYSDEDMERVYWGFGTHWGVAATQSALGDKLGRVSKAPVGPGNPAARGYKSDQELKPHTDSFEIVGLLCLQKAQVGGESQIVSSLAIHNEILRTRPELLEPLYRGFPYATSEASITDTPLTPGVVPVFSCVNGVVSSRYVRNHMRRAARTIGVSIPNDLDAAMDYYEALSIREDLQLAFTLEAGEMLFFNNFVTLHARSEFSDGETQKRQLLRLWLEVPNGRPSIAAYDWQAQAYKRVGEKAKAAVEAVG